MAKLLITMDYLGFFGGVISTNPAENASIPTHFLFYGRDLGSMLILFALEGFLKILAIGGINSQQKRPEQR